MVSRRERRSHVGDGKGGDESSEWELSVRRRGVYDRMLMLLSAGKVETVNTQGCSLGTC